MASPVERATAYVGVAVGRPGDETVVLHAVRAHFITNSAQATATFSVCRTRPGQRALGSATGDALHRYCSSVTPVREGTRFHLSRRGPVVREYLLMTLTPTVPGTASVDRVDFDYARSWRHLGQRGTEHSAQQWTVHATS